MEEPGRLQSMGSLRIWIKAVAVHMDFPGGSAAKESTCNVGELDSIPQLGRSPAEGKGYPLQYCGLENSMGSQRVGHD